MTQQTSRVEAALAGKTSDAASGQHDLRAWLARMQAAGLVRAVSGAHWNREIGAITDMNVKRNKWVLLFDDIPDYPHGFRILTGSLLDARRVSDTFGLGECTKDLDLVRAFRQLLTTRQDTLALSTKHGSPSHEVPTSPVFTNTLSGDAVDLLRLPACRWHKEDGGRYLGTFDAVITRDPESGWINVGTYRLMVRDSHTLCIFMNASHHGDVHLRKYAERGERMPIAISLGHHPLIAALGGLEIPAGVSEFDYAGMLRGEPYQIVRGPLTGLPLPADSEVVVEGYVSHDRVEEGPYGEFLGYYAGGRMQTPTIDVRAIYYRNDPILLGTAAGIPPYDYSYYRCPIRSAMIWNALDRAGVPNVTGVWSHEAGYSRALIIVAIKQAYKGHAQQAGFVASQVREGAFGGKYVIVVDEDIDPTDTNQVLWALTSRTDPAQSIEFIRNSWGMALDPMVERASDQALNELPMSRAVINACKPIERLNRGRFPPAVVIEPELVERLRGQYTNLFEGHA